MFAGLLFLIGGAFAAAYLGFVDVPGISPLKFGKPVKPSSDPKGGLVFALIDPVRQISVIVDAAAKVAAKKPPPRQPDMAPKVNPTMGDLKLAAFWNGLSVDQLEKVTEKWQPAALAKVMLKMDEDQATKLLDKLPPARADQISRAIQGLASQLPKTTSG